jgi:hypothetical protein
LSSFKPITIQGVTYAFEHLAQMTINVAVGKDDAARTFSVLINFSCHCFTDTLDVAVHTPDYHYFHGSERRAFSHSRFERSRTLPAIMEAIDNKRVYFTNQNNYVLIEIVDAAGVKVPYTVFFDMKKGRKGIADVVMTVASAYEKPGMTTKAPTIRFHTLVAKTARGEKPTPTQPQRIKRK